MGKNDDWKREDISEDKALGEIASEEIFEKDPELAKELAENRKIQEKAQQYKEIQAARKQQKQKRALIAVISVAVLIGAGLGGYKIYKENKAKAAKVNEVTAEDGQELLYGKVTSISGNDITITKTQASTGDSTEKPSFDGKKPEGKTSFDGEKPEGKPSFDGEKPEGKPSFDEEMPEGFSPDNLPEDFKGEMPEESINLQIPVGTEVITKLGTSATFSSISTGDVLAIALEEGTDIIDKIWIVE